jgi:hypothetical protein
VCAAVELEMLPFALPCMLCLISARAAACSCCRGNRIVSFVRFVFLQFSQLLVASVAHGLVTVLHSHQQPSLAAKCLTLVKCVLQHAPLLIGLQLAG